MSARLRVLAAMPLLVVIALLAVVAEAWVTALLLTAALAAAALVGPRSEISPGGQALLGFAVTVLVFALGSALTSPDAPQGPLAMAWASIAAAALLNAALRFAVTDPRGGPPVTYGMGLVALLACGETRSGAIYVVAVATYLLTALWALRAVDGERPPWRRLSRQSRVLSVAIPLVVGVAGYLLIEPLHPLHAWVQRRLELAYFAGELRVGFGDRMKLGAMGRMLTSDEVVLRLYGAPREAPPDYLRGIVYDRYEAGRWTYRGAATLRDVTVARGRPEGDGARGGAVEVRRIGGVPDRYFLPRDTAAMGVPSGVLRVDPMGATLRVPGDAGNVAWFLPGARPADAPPIAPPSTEDRRLPRALFAPLARLALEWTHDVDDPAEKLARIAGHLTRDYTYALDVPRADGRDPLLDFLFEHRAGHCEYFAAAMAMLARSLGIPTRVVAGYRVAEYNPIGNYFVVREKNAHAWVEAYVEGRGWVTVDATPGTAAAQNEARNAGWGAAISDALAERWERARGWLAERSATELGSGALAATAALVLVQWLRQRGRRTRRPLAHDVAVAAPLPCLESLLRALAKRGHARAPHETLECFAARLEDPMAAGLVLRYAGHRYGRVGDLDALAHEIDAFIRQMS